MTSSMNLRLLALASILKRSVKDSLFCTQFSTTFKNLKLIVDPNGEINLPISQETAKSLIRYAQPAKFGLRENTIYDPRVRNVWEIPHDRLHLEEHTWQKTMGTALEQIQKDLGLHQKGQLVAQLHNLLIYESGQFFLGHQDSEKTDHMIGTLVIQLPSDFSGGDLIIEQHGEKRIFPALPNPQQSLNFIAFYADCQHEVTEVKTGYRIALTYNLIFEAPDYAIFPRNNELLNKEIQNYFSKKTSDENKHTDKKSALFLNYLLDHEYSEKSLSWSGLKGADRIRAEELVGAAQNLNLSMHLVLADFHQSWSAEDPDKPRYWRKHYEYDDEDYDSKDNYVLGELLSDDCRIYHWIDLSNQVLDYPAVQISSESQCWTKSADDFKPFKSDYEGYMGNYGNTLDRWYHRAAIVIWEKEFEIENLFEISPNTAFKKITSIVSSNKKKAVIDVSKIIPLWSDYYAADRIDPSWALTIAENIDDSRIANELLAPLSFSLLNRKTVLHFLFLAGVYGEKWLISLLNQWQNKRHRKEPIDSQDFICLIEVFNEKFNETTNWLLKYQLFSTINSDLHDEALLNFKEIRETQDKRNNKIISILKASQLSDNSEIHKSILEHILLHPRCYASIELVKIIQNTLPQASSNLYIPYCTQLLATIESRLIQEEASRKRQSGDWSIIDPIPCKCTDCSELKKFLADSILQKKTWPLAKDRRQHIHQIIDGMDISVTHSTERTGSPYKLILTKTKDLFKKDDSNFSKILESLKILRTISSHISNI